MWRCLIECQFCWMCPAIVDGVFFVALVVVWCWAMSSVQGLCFFMWDLWSGTSVFSWGVGVKVCRGRPMWGCLIKCPFG